MGQAVGVRGDFKAGEVRRLAKRARDVGQARRLLAIAAVLDGASRAEAAKVGGMDRQTLRDWVIRFNEHGPDGFPNRGIFGQPPPMRRASGFALLTAEVERTCWRQYCRRSPLDDPVPDPVRPRPALLPTTQRKFIGSPVRRRRWPCISNRNEKPASATCRRTPPMSVSPPISTRV